MGSLGGRSYTVHLRHAPWPWPWPCAQAVERCWYGCVDLVKSALESTVYVGSNIRDVGVEPDRRLVVVVKGIRAW